MLASLDLPRMLQAVIDRAVMPGSRLLRRSSSEPDRPALFAAVAIPLTLLLWPASDPAEVPHEHPELLADHPHLAEHGTGSHTHADVIDELHGHWPRRV